MIDGNTCLFICTVYNLENKKSFWRSFDKKLVDTLPYRSVIVSTSFCLYAYFTCAISFSKECMYSDKNS